MFIFSSIKIAIILTFLAAVTGGYVYIQQLKSDLDVAVENSAKMSIAVQISEQSLELERQEYVRITELNIQLEDDLYEAQAYGNELRNTLQKHKLTHLANMKPVMIEKRMQNATNKLWEDLTSITDPNWVQHDTQSSNSN